MTSHDHLFTSRIPRARFGQLACMMALQYMAYGSWWATLGLVLNSNGLGSIVGAAYSLAAVGAIISSLFTGAIADRFFESQKVMSALHVASGTILLLAGPMVRGGSADWFLLLIFVYMLFFQPTLTMANNIAFANIPERSNAFAHIRAFGTGGWIVVGLIIGQTGLSASTGIFLIGSLLSFVLGIYALTLPKTLPPAKGAPFSWGDVIGQGAFDLFRQRSFLILVLSLLLTALPIAIYNSYGSTYLNAAGVPNVASFMTIGQATEIVALMLIPLLLNHFRLKWILVVGFIAWVIRAFALASMTNGNIALAALVVALHGICSDFVLLAAFIFVDSIAPAKNRAQAQALVYFVSFGVGNATGSLLAGSLFNSLVENPTDVSNWSPLWYIVGGLTALASLLMCMLFNSQSHGRSCGEKKEADDGMPGFAH